MRDPRIASLAYAEIHQKYENCIGYVTTTSKIYEQALESDIEIISIGNLNAN